MKCAVPIVETWVEQHLPGKPEAVVARRNRNDRCKTTSGAIAADCDPLSVNSEFLRSGRDGERCCNSILRSIWKGKLRSQTVFHRYHNKFRKIGDSPAHLIV